MKYFKHSNSRIYSSKMYWTRRVMQLRPQAIDPTASIEHLRFADPAVQTMYEYMVWKVQSRTQEERQRWRHSLSYEQKKNLAFKTWWRARRFSNYRLWNTTNYKGSAAYREIKAFNRAKFYKLPFYFGNYSYTRNGGFYSKRVKYEDYNDYIKRF